MVEIPIRERWETVTSPNTLNDKKAGALLLSHAQKDFCNQSTQTNSGQTPVFQKRWRREVRNGLTGQCKAVESWVLQCSSFLYPIHVCLNIVDQILNSICKTGTYELVADAVDNFLINININIHSVMALHQVQFDVTIILIT